MFFFLNAITALALLVPSRMNDCAPGSSLPVLEHGIHPQMPIRGNPLQHWIDFVVDEHFNTSYLNASTFHYSTIINGEIMNKRVSPLCEEIDCNEIAGHIVTFADDWDTSNLPPGETVTHIIEFYDEHGTQLLCSEAEFLVDPIHDAMLAISAP